MSCAPFTQRGNSAFTCHSVQVEERLDDLRPQEVRNAVGLQGEERVVPVNGRRGGRERRQRRRKRVRRRERRARGRRRRGRRRRRRRFKRWRWRWREGCLEERPAAMSSAAANKHRPCLCPLFSLTQWGLQLISPLIGLLELLLCPVCLSHWLRLSAASPALYCRQHHTRPAPQNLQCTSVHCLCPPSPCASLPPLLQQRCPRPLLCLCHICTAACHYPARRALWLRPFLILRLGLTQEGPPQPALG